MSCRPGASAVYAAALLLMSSWALVSCEDTAPDNPEPIQVVPAQGYNHVTTRITILGDEFQPLITANYDDEEQAVVSTAFVVELGKKALAASFEPDAQLCASSIYHPCLKATVPAGLAPGTYNLTVIDPRGRSGVLKAGYTVLLPTSDAGPDASPDAAPDAGPDAAPDFAPDFASDLPPVDQSPDAPVIDAYTGPIVTTVAGSGVQGLQNGAAASARFFNPRGIVVSGATIYVSDYGNHMIRTISGGQVKTYAGTGSNGNVNGPLATASFNFPMGLALTSTGALLVADSSNDLIRWITSGTTVSTMAGSGIKGFLNGSAAVARFNYPLDVFRSGGVIYIADSGNHRIRKIDGVVSTVAGNGVKGFLNGNVLGARFSSPSGVAVAGGNIYVADSENNQIRMISGGQVTTLAGATTKGSADGPAASARFWNPSDVVVSGTKIFVADQSNHKIRLIENGQVSTLAGSFFGHKDGPAKNARFFYPHGLALGTGNTLYVTDQSNHRIRLITY